MEGEQDKEIVGKFERTTQGQLQFFINFCKEHPELQQGKSKINDPELIQSLWEEVADNLNAMRGPTRSADRWRISLIHWRHQIRSRARKRKEQSSLDSNPQTVDSFVGAAPVRRNPNDSELQAKRKHFSRDSRVRLTCDKVESSKMNPSIVDTLAQTWASQYNEMETHQKVIARKIISDVLFQGCVGGLTIHHTKKIENIFSSQDTDTDEIQKQESVTIVPEILHTNTRKHSTSFNSSSSCTNTSFTNKVSTRPHNTESIYFAEDSSNGLEESLLDEM